MFGWIWHFFSLWSAWSASWNPDAILSHWMPLVMGVSALIGFCLGAFVAKVEDHAGFFKSLGVGMIGMVIGALLGFIVGAFIIMLFPIIVLSLVIAVLGTASFALLYYGTPLLAEIPRAVRRIPDAIGWFKKKIRRITKLRPEPEDCLLQLDADAQDVERRRRELAAQQVAAAERAQESAERIRETEEIRKNFSIGNAGRQIADNLLVQFHENLRIARGQASQLDSIVRQIELGQREMHTLISLARLCRKAGEKSIAEDTRAIAAARNALRALQVACEQADAVLSAAVVQADMDVTLAFQQLDEGLRRSTKLADSVDTIGMPPPTRTRA